MTADTPVQMPPELLWAKLLRLMEKDPDLAGPAHVYKIGEAATLDDAMGIGGGQGIAKVRTHFRRKDRDRYLRNALELLGGDLGALSAEIGSFMSRKWPVWKNRDTAPERATAIEVELFRACRLNGGRLPGSARHLRRLVT